MESFVDSNKLFQPPQIMGKSGKILRLFREIKKISSKDGAVLITGETGTYKELVARAIHHNSSYMNGPFVAVNLSSIPDELKITEVFGYDGGRVSGKPGRIESAYNGTVFFAEIADADSNFQGRILEFLKAPSSSNGNDRISAVKVICSTCKNLKDNVSNGDFNKELFEIIRNTDIKIPPLRERKEDILYLGNYFLMEASAKFKTGEKEFSRDAMDFLMKYEWPGNIRELENTIKKAAILSNGAMISKKDLMIDDMNCFSMKEFLEEKLKRYLKEMTKLDNCRLYETVMSEVEKSLITIVLKETDGNQLKTAKTLGINRNTLRSKIKEYKIRM
jgi:two-component system, NtrC family, nitrogen regulation response regulator GlnG